MAKENKNPFSRFSSRLSVDIRERRAFHKSQNLNTTNRLLSYKLHVGALPVRDTRVCRRRSPFDLRDLLSITSLCRGQSLSDECVPRGSRRQVCTDDLPSSYFTIQQDVFRFQVSIDDVQFVQITNSRSNLSCVETSTLFTERTFLLQVKK